jgi:hypothetical protein
MFLRPLPCGALTLLWSEVNTEGTPGIDDTPGMNLEPGRDLPDTELSAHQLKDGTLRLHRSIHR